MDGYKARLVNCKQKDLSPVDRIKYENFIANEKLVDHKGESIEVMDWCILHVENERSQEKEYEKFFAKATDGTIYSTSSQSFMDSFVNIAESLNEVNVGIFTISVLEKKSKNNQGSFLICQLE